MTLIHIDGRKLTDARAMHVALAEAFGFPSSYGNNLDALIDCLSHLDDPKSAMTRVQVGRGQVLTLVIDHSHAMSKHKDLFEVLAGAVAFVNGRRIEKGEAPVIALAWLGTH